ncbi:MAG: hypothetical protein A2898_03880 [Candidatus Kerfeldbacteria bacterium RIFCSPLOWO2_01_FULL_48_11]|uniref:Uncharacterized protein n=1 Tax=Candidatus Kerfeldbacteria bacterium RIFCSPLOWO2_01_FULL_48_11 TaxID=1798543 RepID=A0A1G2B7Z9_9BACT|nr:MAG: hypothetical protein A2898_03880 [Candidatus Kerfeldbacteria bacterium RIFCSPLOWO2_01_FULL_48_11]
MKHWIKKTFIIIGLLVVIIFPVVSFAQSEELDAACVLDDALDDEGNLKRPPIELQTRIPGVTHEVSSKDKETGEIVTKHMVRDFPCFLGGIYRYMAGASAIISTVMIMFGGYKYVVSFGSAQRMKDAEDTIVSAMVGLAITLGSYLLLYTVNPALVEFPDIIVKPVAPINQDLDEEGAKQKCRTEQLQHMCGEPFSFKTGGVDYWCCGMQKSSSGAGCVDNLDEWLQVPGVTSTTPKGLCYQGWTYEKLDQRNLKISEPGVSKYGYVTMEGVTNQPTLQDCTTLSPPNCGSGTGCGAGGSCVAQGGICKCMLN